VRLSRLKNRILARVFGVFPSLAERWGKGLARSADEIPWSPPRRPLRDSRVAVITTGGVQLRSQPPFDMEDPDGDASLREVPLDAPPGELAITHDYYDHRDADRDLDLVLPLERLRELERHGGIGSLHPVAYSLMGHIDGRHVGVLVRETAPRIADALARGEVHCALLVPA
jgi:D-proline reductase (dithiol) PrdB